MKLNKFTLLSIVIVVILPLSLLLTSCGSNPIDPSPRVLITSMSPANVSAYTPATGSTSAIAGTGTGSLTLTVQGPSITIDTDNGAVYGVTVLTSGGTGTQTISYLYSNGGTFAPGTIVYDTHIYTYHTVTSGATGTFKGTIQVTYN